MFTINKNANTISGYFNIDNATFDIIHAYSLEAFIKSTNIAEAFDMAINRIANSSHIKCMKPEYIILATHNINTARTYDNPVVILFAVQQIVNDLREKYDICVELEIS